MHYLHAFLPFLYTLVAGYCVFMLAVCVSVHLSVHSTYIRLSILSVHTSFRSDNLSIYKRISFKFCVWVCNVPRISRLEVNGIVNGQILTIYNRVMALVNEQK